MSSRHGRRETAIRRQARVAVATEVSIPRPTRGEAATILSFPTLLLIVHFALQPFLDVWPRFGYVRYSAARAASPEQLAPAPLTAHAWWWHEVTRFSHALVHSPSGLHLHVLGNVAFILFAASALFVLLTAVGLRHQFTLVYWELVVVAPVVGSFSFDLFGSTAHGYGASTIGFAFLGIVVVVALFTLVTTSLPGGYGSRSESIRFGGGHTASPPLVLGVFLVTVFIVGFDAVNGSVAMPVHQAGVGFGVLVGTLLVSRCGRFA